MRKVIEAEAPGETVTSAWMSSSCWLPAAAATNCPGPESALTARSRLSLPSCGPHWWPRLRFTTAGFPDAKSLDTYDFKFPEKIDARLVRELATLGFVKAKEAVWIAGPSGTGKTHIATALGLRAIEEGLSSLHRQMSAIARDLHASIADHSEERRLRFYERIDVLVVEDLGFADIPQESMSLVFDLFNRRYERRATIVTSNLSGDAAEKSVAHQAMAGAVFDRLLHHAHLVTIVGPSWRAKHRPGSR